MKKTIILLQIIFILSCTFSFAEDLSGLWLWEENSNNQTFSIKLTKNKQGYSGTYCAIGMSGSKIDCSPKNEISFKVEKLNKPFKYKANYSDTGGVAKLIAMNNGIVWEMIEEPKGEHYAPKTAKLIKQK